MKIRISLHINFFFVLLSFVVVTLFITRSQAQQVVEREKFGKNRVQHHRFYWSTYKTNNFDIYHYDGSTRTARYGARYLETEYDKLADLLGYSPFSKSKVFIYSSIYDLQQSNIDLERQQPVITGGQASFFTSHSEIPYPTNDFLFRQELRQGMSKIYVYEMLHGGSLKDILSNTFLNDFSDWFQYGAVEYVSKGWNEEMDNFMRDMFLKKKRVKKPSLLTGKEAIMAGQSVWNYIAEKHGKNSISNVLNLARILRNERNSIATTLGTNYKKFLKEWQLYYATMTKQTVANTEPPEYDTKIRKKNRKRFGIQNIQISPDGNKVAYPQNQNGRYKVIVQDLNPESKKKSKKVVYSGGYDAIYQRFDDNVPILDWKNSQELAMVLNKNGNTTIAVYDITQKKIKKRKPLFEKEFNSLNQIHSFDISEDGSRAIISADRKGLSNARMGQNDLILYDFDLNYVDEITADWQDDLYPSFLANSNSQIVFSSNREDDELEENKVEDLGPFDKSYGNLDLFLYDLDNKGDQLQRITSGNGNETKAIPLDEQNILYLSDESGIFQIHKLELSTLQTKALTNYYKSIKDFDINYQTGSLAYLMIEKGRDIPFLKNNFDFENPVELYKTTRIDVQEARNDKVKDNRPLVPDNIKSKSNPIEKEEPYGEDEINTDDYQFNPEVVAQKKEELEEEVDENPKTTRPLIDIIKRINKKEIKLLGAYQYEPRMKAEGFTTSFQNDPLRGFGFVLGTSMSDILENHRIRGGLLSITDLKSSSIYGEYEYLARRIDYKLRYARDAVFLNSLPVVHRYTSNRFELTMSYPFSNVLRVSATPFYMNTLYTNLNPGLLNLPDKRVDYTGGRIELVYDNTFITGLNMMKGTRLKIAYENYVALGAAGKSFDNFYLDMRNYFRLHRDLIFATRVGFGTFGGEAPKKYLLGGVDNWQGGQTDSPSDGNPLQTDTQQDNSDLLFVKYATNLRGFNYNTLAGTSYLLMNFELRIPIIKYLFGKRINSKFFQNLQLTGFTDIGTAWTKGNPFDKVNSTNTTKIGGNGPFTAEVTSFRNPFLTGYGFGARSLLFGYYLKLDVAWGVKDNAISREPKYHISIGYDF